GVDRLAAGHVEPGAPHRLPALLDARPGRRLARDRGGHLRGRGDAHATDRLLDGGAHLRIQRLDGGRELLRADARRRGAHAVEPLGLLQQGGGAVLAHLGDELLGRLGGHRDVEDRARYELEELGRARTGATEVESLDHCETMLDGPECPDAPPGWTGRWHTTARSR